MDKWLKKLPAKKPRVEDYSDSASTSGKQQENDSVDTSSHSRSLSIMSRDENIDDLAPKKKLPNKVRNYQEAYLKFGFTSNIVNNEPRPTCILCHEMLSNGSMKPSLLVRHLKTKHPEHEHKPLQFFERCLKTCNTQSSNFKKIIKLNDKCLEASLEVSYLIAKDKKPHTIGETLVLPAAVKMVEIIHGKEYADKLKCIPLSANTIGRRIEIIADNLKKQLLKQITQCGKFAIQLDESTDVANLSQLMVFIRYCFNNELHEELLFCEPLKERCTGEDIFSTVNHFFVTNNILWENCLSVTSDGAAALTGTKKGFKGKVTEIAPHVKFVHCIIHRQAIAAKKLEPEIHRVLQDVISVVNFIKRRPLNSRIFTILCNEMGSSHENLLYHTEVRWLSRGKVLKRVVELKDELRIFLLDKDKCLNFASLFSDDKWLLIVCYLADIFEKVNMLNLSLQGKGNILTMSEKVTAFRKKIVMWRENFEKGCLEMFPSLCDFVSENDVNVEQTKSLISTHLKNLEIEFCNLFTDLPSEQFQWMLNPFAENVKMDHLPIISQEQLIDIRENTTLQYEFQQKSLHNWWMGLKTEYPNLVSTATDALLPFGSTYLCEVSFSAMTGIKSKYRNKLNLEPDLRIAVSESIKPEFIDIMKQMQSHCSH